MDALEVIFTRRSIRRYTSKAVTDEELKTLLEAAMNAPSANNQQPARYIVVDDRAKLNAIMRNWPINKPDIIKRGNCEEG